MEEKIKKYFNIYHRYPTYKDFNHSTILPTYGSFKRKCNGRETNVVLAEMLGTRQYIDIMTEYLNNRDLVYFRIKDVVKEPYIPHHSFCRWLVSAKVEGYYIKLIKSASNNNGGVYCATKR